MYIEDTHRRRHNVIACKKEKRVHNKEFAILGTMVSFVKNMLSLPIDITIELDTL